MASERDFELLDDYIGNRMSDADKASFETRLQADPDLTRELKLQQGIVNSLRKARAAELKAMLNNIPPSSIPTSSNSTLTWAGITVAALVAIGLYFYLQPSEKSVGKPVADSATVAPPADQSDAKVPSSDEPSTPEKEEPNVEKPKAKVAEKSVNESVETPTAPGAPEIDVFDPEAEAENEAKAPEVVVPENTSEGSAKTSDIVSEVVSNHRSYDFHYQFKGEKLILYGTFDKNLYSILEFFSDNKRTIFLEYRNNFYLLNPAGDKVKPLSPVNDPVLIQKLREH